MSNLHQPVRIGAWELPNRIVMAPLTRCRASAGRVPKALMALMAEYYLPHQFLNDGINRRGDSYGRLFIANPDLVERLATDAPLNEPDPSSFYGGTEKGYTDYPTLDEVAQLT